LTFTENDFHFGGNDGVVDVAVFVVMSNGKKFAINYGLHDDFVVLFRIIFSNMVIGIPFRS
jgi:hypothetical protein